jgi:hypothetical protein
VTSKEHDQHNEVDVDSVDSMGHTRQIWNKGLYSPAKFCSIKIRHVVSEITRDVRINGRCTGETFPKCVTLTLSDPTSDLVRQYDFPVLLRCRKMYDTVFVAFVRPLSEPVRRFSSCSTDFSQQIAQVVLFLLLTYLLHGAESFLRS